MGDISPNDDPYVGNDRCGVEMRAMVPPVNGEKRLLYNGTSVQRLCFQNEYSVW